MAFGKRKKKSEPMDETTDTTSEVEQPEAAADETPSAPPTLEEQLEAAQAERAEFEAKWLRAQADFQNLRRRTAADIDSAVARAKSEVLAEAITVLDYLDMALAAPVTTDEAKNLQIGVEMTRGQLQGLFDRLQVRPIEASGTFDPALHQAVSTVETDEHEPGTIVEVVRGGWAMGEAVLRFAQVRVAATADEEPEESAEEVTAEESAEAPTDGE